MANKVVKTFEEFISFEIEDSTVHIHIDPKEMAEIEEKPVKTEDEVMVSMPPMNLSSVSSSNYDDNYEESEEDETPESNENEEE